MTDVSSLTFIFSGNQLGPPWSHTISPSVNAQLLYLPMLRTNDELCSLCQVVHWFLIPVSVLCRRFLFDDWIMTDREPRDRNMLRLPTVDLRSRWQLRGSGNGCNFILNEGGWLTFNCSNSPFIKAVPSRRLWSKIWNSAMIQQKNSLPKNFTYQTNHCSGVKHVKIIQVS